MKAQPDKKVDLFADEIAEQTLPGEESGENVEEREPEMKSAVVIGGGITGIQAALDLADARIKVTLVEKSPTLGGRMAQLDKTFPTMDCSI
ncbi:MAG: FAD-dependent oxidoreductase [Planctomycetota bacterium]